MKIAVTGCNGRLGKVLCDSFSCIPMDVDVLSKKSITKFLNVYKPDVVIHSAAVTDVDGCELDELRSKAMRVNECGTAILRECFDGRIIYISTDFIFDGKRGPYSESDEPNPINWYGQTKLGGEEALKEFGGLYSIVRTTNLFGGHKFDFVRSIVTSLKADTPVEVTTKLVGNPTHVAHLAMGLKHLLKLPSIPKVINISGTDNISKYDFAILIANVFGFDPELIHPTDRVSGTAKRPRQAGFKLMLAKRLKIPLFSALDGLNQMYVGGNWTHY